MEKNDNMLPIGTLLRGGTYRVTRQLKSGGFGNTYMVENVHFCETYAMKEFFMQGVTTRTGTTVSISQADNAEIFRSQKEKFKKEAQRIRKLNHPNIVKIYDLFEDNDTYYYVMDYIDGQSLADRLKSSGAMSEVEAMVVLKKVLVALQAVHAADFTHMDIKPGNIMQDRVGKVYLIDFGASKQMTSSEQRTLNSTTMPYTEGYAPMEQIEKEIKNVGPWTDLYAVGATMYRMLTDRQPPSSTEIINDDDPFVFSSGVSERTQSLIKWMMEPSRKKRPQSVLEVIQRLENNTQSAYPSLKGEDTHFDAYDGTAKTESQTIYSTVNDEEGVGRVILSPIIERLISNMVYVEGGTFMMGATSEQGSDAYDDEKPAHEVTLSSFSIGKYEVTQEEWEAVMGSNPSRFRGAKRPVECVSWDDCQEFISRLNQMTGKQFRLPTEAEWEYAARGGTSVEEKRFGLFGLVSSKSRSFKYPGSSDIEAVAWYDGKSNDETHPVGQKQPNGLGLYDMSGNVMEWCQDWYGSYSSLSQTNPTGPTTGSSRVRRGGSWDINARLCRVSLRYYNTPSFRDTDLGLRLALQ